MKVKVIFNNEKERYKIYNGDTVINANEVTINEIPIDSELSDSSANAVENKVVKEALDQTKADIKNGLNLVNTRLDSIINRGSSVMAGSDFSWNWDTSTSFSGVSNTFSLPANTVVFVAIPKDTIINITLNDVVVCTFGNWLGTETQLGMFVTGANVTSSDNFRLVVSCESEDIIDLVEDNTTLLVADYPEELKDIRTDYYGVQWANAGDAVRSIMEGIENSKINIANTINWTQTTSTYMGSANTSLTLPLNKEIDITLPAQTIINFSTRTSNITLGDITATESQNVSFITTETFYSVDLSSNSLAYDSLIEAIDLFIKINIDITIDTSMSDSSENAVQNKVIKAYIDNETASKQDTLTDGDYIKIDNNTISVDTGKTEGSKMLSNAVINQIDVREYNYITFTKVQIGSGLPSDITMGKVEVANDSEFTDPTEITTGDTLSVATLDYIYLKFTRTLGSGSATAYYNLISDDNYLIRKNDIKPNDTEMSDESENAVENKVIKSYVDTGLDTKAPAIIDTANGSSITLTDSYNAPIKAISIMGKSTQNGTPTIDNPIPIVDITAEEIEVTNGTDTQTANLNLTLRGIPVTSGGNYTDSNGQSWLCDTIERYADGSGKLIQRVGIVDNSKWTKNNVASGTTGERYTVEADIVNLSRVMCNLLEYSDVSSYGTEGDYVTTRGVANSVIIRTTRIFGNANAFIQWAETNNLFTIYCMNTAQETPLTAEQLAELDLSTYYPVTNINSNTDVVVTYVCDTKNYIDKKLAELNTVNRSVNNVSLTKGMESENISIDTPIENTETLETPESKETLKVKESTDDIEVSKK